MHPAKGVSPPLHETEKRIASNASVPDRLDRRQAVECVLLQGTFPDERLALRCGRPEFEKILDKVKRRCGPGYAAL